MKIYTFFWTRKKYFVIIVWVKAFKKEICISYRKSLNCTKFGDLKSSQSNYCGLWGNFIRKFTADSAKTILWEETDWAAGGSIKAKASNRLLRLISLRLSWIHPECEQKPKIWLKGRMHVVGSITEKMSLQHRSTTSDQLEDFEKLWNFGNERFCKMLWEAAQGKRGKKWTSTRLVSL